MMVQKGVFFLKQGLKCLTMALLIAGAIHPQATKAEIVDIDELPRVEVDGENNYWKDIVIDEKGEPVNLSQGVMPSTGNPKIAIQNQCMNCPSGLELNYNPLSEIIVGYLAATVRLNNLQKS